MGITGALSGSSAPFSRQVIDGARLAVADLNKSGGLLGFAVEPIVRDDAGAPEKAVQIASEFADQGIQFIIGPTYVRAALASSPKYSNVLQIIPAVTAVQLTRQGFAQLFRIITNDQQEAEAASKFIIEQRGKRVTVVHDNTPYGLAILGAIRNLSSDAMQAVTIEPVVTDDSLDPTTTKIGNSGAEIIYAALQPDQAGRLALKIRQQGMRPKFVSGPRALTSDFIAAAGSAATDSRSLSALSVNAPEFVRATSLLQQAGMKPDLFALHGFAAVQVWSEAVRRAGNGDPANVAKTLKLGEFNTAVGKVSFDDMGDRRGLEFSLLRWSDGRITQ
jgi:branched-chain amino acid transport system substrate-binding protein